MIKHPTRFGAKTGTATRIKEFVSHVHLTHCQGCALQLTVGDTMKAIKIMRGSLDATSELNKLINFSKILKS